jgi:hypothetical protein
MAMCSQGGFSIGIHVSIDEILQDELRVAEIRSVVVIGLSVDLAKGLLEVLIPPD